MPANLRPRFVVDGPLTTIASLPRSEVSACAVSDRMVGQSLERAPIPMPESGCAQVPSPPEFSRRRVSGTPNSDVVHRLPQTPLGSKPPDKLFHSRFVA